MFSCVLDDETETADGFDQFGYDGEDFISLDLKNLTWLYSEQASTYKEKWKKDNNELIYRNKIITRCPECLNKFVTYGKSYLGRKGKIT